MCGNSRLCVGSKMPASSGDPVSTALHMSLTGNKCSTLKNDDLDTKIVASARRILLSEIQYEKSGSYSSTVLDSLKTKYIILNTNVSDKVEVKLKNGPKDLAFKETKKVKTEVGLPTPKKVLFPQDAIQLGWQGHTPIGAGMVNMGNTCYLNSTLQALFHIPAFVNWITNDKSHVSKCQLMNGLTHSECLICAMNKTLQFAQRSTGTPMKPIQIYSKLKSICKHLVHGHQEDAHEFLRYLIESMELSYLHVVGGTKLDSYSKETTPLNQIFGGYLRTEVTCLECRHVSTTFQHFQDLLLDIRTVASLEDALEVYFGREQLGDGEEAYRCEQCHRRVAATKKFTIQKAPNVLCLQLKRFGIMGGKISKHISLQMNLDITRFMHQSSCINGRLRYRLVSMISHIGPSSGCGHYTAMAASSGGQYYLFDDSMVRPVSLSGVFNTNAYVIMYELEPPPTSSPSSTVQRATKSVPSSPISTSNGLNGKILQNGELISSQSSPLSSKFSLVSAASLKTERASTSTQLTSASSSSSSPSPKHLKLTNGSTSPSKSLVPYTPNESSDSESENASNGYRVGKQLSVQRGSTSSPKEQKISLANGVCKDSQHKSQPSLFSPSKAGPAKDTSPVPSSPPLKVNSIPHPLSTLSAGGPCKMPNTIKKEKSLTGPGLAAGVQGSSPLKKLEVEETPTPAPASSPLLNGWHVTESSNHSSCSSTSSSVGSRGLWNITETTKQRTSEEDVFPGTVATFENIPISTIATVPENSPSEEQGLNSCNGRNSTKNERSSLNVSGEQPSSGKMWDGSRDTNTVSQLLKMSHRGYGASGVSTWNGGRSELDQEVDNDKVEQKKRAHNSSYDDDLDRGKVKKMNTYSTPYKSDHRNENGRQRYNPFQDHQNRKNGWYNGKRHSFYQQYNNIGRYRNRHHNSYHKQNGFNRWRH